MKMLIAIIKPFRLDAVREALAEGALQPLLPEWRIAPVAFHAVYPASSYVPAKVRAFVDFATVRLRANRLVN